MSQRKNRHESSAPRRSPDSLHLGKEVRAIQRRAAEHEARILSIGPLVFFSTDTGDAWMLEPADQLAIRLACGGDPLPVQIEETDTRYDIGWQGNYHIDGDTFVYRDKQSRRINAIEGYPVKKLLHLISES
jgi:hypothetical protein